jgi:hypothetical protein
VRHRPARLLRRSFTGHSHYLANLLGSESRRCPATRPIGQDLLFYASSKGPLTGFLCCLKTFCPLQPCSAPQAHRLPIEPEFSGNLLVIGTVRDSKNDASTAREPLGSGCAPPQMHQHLALAVGEGDRWR